MPDRFTGVFAIAPLAYIIFWFYALVAWIIPTWNVTLGDILSLTLWSIIGSILFFVPGIILLIVCIVVVASIMAN